MLKCNISKVFDAEYYVFDNNNIMAALYRGFAVSAILSAILLYFVTDYIVGLNSILVVEGTSAQFTGMSLFICGLLGLIITGLIIWVTEYYTGTNYRPVQSIAQSSTTGHGTNVIQGLAISLEATALPALIIVAGIIIISAALSRVQWRAVSGTLII